MINSSLMKIYRTKKPFTEFWFDGLGNLISYHYVMELDNGKKYEFHCDHLCEWDGREKIIELETEFKNGFKDKCIIDVIGSETDGIYFKLENDMIIYHDETFGSELGFEKYAKIFNENGQLI